MKNYVGISRDHSASMRSLTSNATKDYNLNVDSIKEGAKENGIDTVVSVIECGAGDSDKTKFVVVNSSVNSLKPLTSYEANGGGTPLFDSVGELIEQLSLVPDASDPSVSFLIMVITDGQENASRRWTGDSLGRKIRELQGTDKWTFTFRVPRGSKQTLVRLGIPEYNILEWEQTERGFEAATISTQSAVRSYYSARASGQTASSRFYSNIGDVSAKYVKTELNDITKDCQFFPVKKASSIRDFIEFYVGTYQLGKGFYQLTKPETVQGNKLIAIRNKSTGRVYAGDSARDLMNVPKGGDIKLYPGNHGNYDVFIQSTSVNRKLLPLTEVLYWKSA